MPTWNGSSNSNWFTAINWSGSSVPSFIDDVFINNGGLPKQPTILAADSATVNSVSISAGSLSLSGSLTAALGVTLSGAGRLSLTANSSLVGNLFVTNSLGTFTNAGSIVGNVNFSSSGTHFVNAGTVTGTITFGISGTYESTIAGSNTVIGGTSGILTVVLNRSTFTSALVVDISDGGGGRNIGDGTKLTNVDNLTVQGGAAADILSGNSLVDNLTGNDGDDTLSGNGGNDILTGGAGNDALDGGTGADTMNGGAGNDEYVVDNADDVVIDSSGVDTVIVTLSSYSMNSSTIENFIYDGDSNINVVGNSLANTLRGGFGNDVLNGGGGADHMTGLSGNDIYVITSSADIVEEDFNQGVDTIRRSNGNLDLSQYANVENAALLGSADNSLFGSTVANKLQGNIGNNTLFGGLGADVLFGGAGNDMFRFESAIESLSAQRDRIMDFVQDEDLIDLLTIDAKATMARNNAFAWIDGAEFSAGGVASEGELRFEVRGSYTIVEGDTNGDGIADFEVALFGNFTLSDADFVL